MISKKTKTYKSVGCAKCNFTGYKGRTVVSEIFKVDEVLSEMITNKCSAGEIKKYLIKSGMIFLSEDAAAKVKLGETSIDEIKREALLSDEGF